MTPDEIAAQADAWIAYWKAPKGSPSRLELSWAVDTLEFEEEDPESVWALILDIHHKDQSVKVQQVLSAGPIEDLLSQHGKRFIDRVENEARRDRNLCESLWWRLETQYDRRSVGQAPECLGQTRLGRHPRVRSVPSIYIGELKETEPSHFARPIC